MPSIHRHLMRQGLAARARLHTAEHDLERLTLHCMDLERTLYRLAMVVCADKLVTLDEATHRALPHDEAGLLGLSIVAITGRAKRSKGSGRAGMRKAAVRGRGSLEVLK